MGTAKLRGTKHPAEDGDMAEPEFEPKLTCVSARQRHGTFWKCMKVRKVSTDSRLISGYTEIRDSGEKVENVRKSAQRWPKC